MGLKDTFVFDEAEYTARMAGESDLELKKREVVKIRQRYSSSAKVVTGVGMTHATGGASLLTSAHGARQHNIAEQKLAIVQKELQKRNIKLHEMRKRDVVIPIASFYVGFGLGLGLAPGVEEVVTVGIDQLVDSSSVPNNFTSEPGDFVKGVIVDAQQQVSEVYLQAAHGIPVQNPFSAPEMMHLDLADMSEALKAVTIEKGTFLCVTRGLVPHSI